MAAQSKAPSSWVYPDRDAWETLLSIHPKPRPVTEKPEWWRGPWPSGNGFGENLSSDQKLEVVKKEFAWARKCFYYAESVLPDSAAKEKAGRIARVLGRANQALDSREKATDVFAVVHELSRIGRYDPQRHPRAFVETAGGSVAAAGKVMEDSQVESMAYWGRALARAGRYFQTMKYDLFGG